MPLPDPTSSRATATAGAVVLALAGAATAARWARARRVSHTVASPGFFRSLVFRPGADRVGAGAFTALSPEYGEVLVSWKHHDDGAERQRLRDAVLRGGAPCTLGVANGEYAFFKMTLTAAAMARAEATAAATAGENEGDGGAGERLSLEVALLGRMPASAARKAVAKRFPAPAATLLETPTDHARFLAERGGPEGIAAENKWVADIVFGDNEADRVVAETDHGLLMLHPSKSWDDNSQTSMRLLFLFADRSLTSIRDLRGHHLPMLRAVKAAIEEAVCRFMKEAAPAGGGYASDDGGDGAVGGGGGGFAPERLLLFFHYRPTFWWLHLHVVPLDGFSFREAGRSHELGELMRKLEASPDCMRDAVLLVKGTEAEVEAQRQHRASAEPKPEPEPDEPEKVGAAAAGSSDSRNGDD